MQALSLAIGPAGITYFTQQLVAQQMTDELARITPPDRTIPIPPFTVGGFGYSDSYSNVAIVLSNGSLSGFAPKSGTVVQKSGGKFDLTLQAQAFTAHYKWHESYSDYSCVAGDIGPVCNWINGSDDYPYGPVFGSLTTVVTLGFQYNATSKTYDVVLAGTPTTSTAGVQPNVPGQSVIQTQVGSCFSSHVSDATAASVSAIDFSKPIADVFPPLIKSIAGSGHLTDDITYDFGVGDSGMSFPGDAGIAIGITGSVSYKGTPYPGTPPTGLPVPPPPTDSHHLQTYVSNYELNALYWAFYQAGRLTLTINATDLPDPDALHCKTYANWIKSLKRYSAFAMRADIAPKAPPTVSFQKVWVLNTAAMQTLQAKLPANVYTLLGGLAGNGYVTEGALDGDLQDAGINQQYWPTITQAAYAPGMALAQSMRFTLTILDGEPEQPNIVFDLTRTDILQNLGLGKTQAAGSDAQTLMFDFLHAVYDATFVSSTVPDFDGSDFGDKLWPTIGEIAYDKELAAIGHTGTPLPIMSGFHFLFDQAQLSIQEGFVSILANAAFTKP
ncbi:hypothetical protein [Yinghuangia seranimata]|uniref:hypothetical protein n=1 Tax=Yinghuangia seranimata TaxID=408067 RepID=UPI00248BE58D|nr:hypothetical protein [Yinghuangia seranimata]MDI2124980.1 hypothetical protein [Yinghuangia seranimata]